ncbi:bifunctional folylpolyglutamate synthase/dihydrofolate synthase [Bartonella tamiae]|nr:folylpolyglutamate synthase/dihydrofolate synthase family protein [Bartonella tamiae]
MQLHPKGFDLSLQRISGLLARLDNPHLKLPPIIHIAGTNGKGSATANCRSLLESAGYTVHVHTSPHLVSWHERYRMAHKDGGQFVTDDVLADAIERVATANNGCSITVFEILTAVAFLLFSEHPADAVILEVGLGGRFDATNVIPKPAVSLIMPIALDHEAFLGHCVEKIAFEKGGIIKDSAPVVIAHQADHSAISVLTDLAEKKCAPLSIYGQDYHAHEENSRMIFQNQLGLWDLPMPCLQGAHQIDNSAAAIEAVLQAGFQLSDDHMAHAMRHIVWPGRMQSIKQGKLVETLHPLTKIIIDGGHNPAAAKVVAQALKKLKEQTGHPIVLIVGMINTKDSEGYFKELLKIVDKVITVPILNSDAAITPEDLCEVACRVGFTAQSMKSLEQAFHLISKDKTPQTVLIGGSLYLAGEFLSLNHTLPE